MLSAINLREKLSKLNELWSPRVVAEMNDYQFKVVKLQGDFVWHRHEDTDEVFIVLDGEMEVGFHEQTATVRAGELFVVPRGREHITRARSECHALIIEPRGVLNTGDAQGALTARNDVWI